jgi:hypothetical protein
MEDIVEGGRIILKCILNKYDMRIFLTEHFPEYRVRKSFYEGMEGIHLPQDTGE